MPLISYAANIAVSNGPTLALQGTCNVEAYDVIAIEVPSGAEDLAVALQPGAAGAVQLIAITADSYSAELSYKVNDAGEAPRTLDQPHLFTGVGAVSLLSGDALASLLFSNATADADARSFVVTIFVGRDATS